MEQFDVTVLGGGPAGYVAAIKAAKMGGKVALVEKGVLGGTCLNRGCIPTKAYLHNAEVIENVKHSAARGITLSGEIQVDMAKTVATKDKIVKKLTGGVAGLIKANKITLIKGEGKFDGKDVTVDGRSVGESKKIILCSGSVSSRLPIPGADHKNVLLSEQMLELKEVPARLCIIGGGVIGVEMAQAFAAFGSKVTIVEGLPTILPMMDEELSATLKPILEKKGIRIITGNSLTRIDENKNGLSVVLQDDSVIEADKVLLSIGRRADLSAVDGSGIAIKNNYIAVDDYMRTSIPGVYAAGDVTGRSMLAHSAFHMGEIAAANAMGKMHMANLSRTPSCVYGSPEVAGVGLTEKQAAEMQDIKVGKFPFAANGRALATEAGEGFVKVITGAKYSELLGVHIIGPSATEIINEAAALMSMEITATEIAGIIHAHPTFSEAFYEAATDSLGQCIHLP